MWKSAVGVKPVLPPKPQPDDDWETDPDFVNDVGEKNSRWGAKTIEGSGHTDSFKLDQLRDEVLKSDVVVKEKTFVISKASEGYGGKFGVQTDRVDSCAEKYDYQGKVEKHASQLDYAKGFGGVHGVQTDRVDKSAVGWNHREALQQHESQKDYKQGFGGKFGVQADRVDKSAADWSHREALQQHESQTGYKQGFGGKFGVQSDRVDKSAVDWSHREALQKHESQTDYKKGFGGLFGVQNDRKDKCAAGWDDHEKLNQHESQTDYKKGFTGSGSQIDKSLWEKNSENALRKSDAPPKVETEKGKASSLRSKFEQMATQNQDDQVRQERERRQREDEALRKRQAEEERARQARLDEEWAQRKAAGEVVEEDELPNEASENGGDGDHAPKARPSSIGVRLPYSTALPEHQRQPSPVASSQSDIAPPKPMRNSEYLAGGELANKKAIDEQHSPPDEPSQQPRVPPVAASAISEISSMMRHRRKSSTDQNEDDDDDEWEDGKSKTVQQSQKQQFVLQQPPAGNKALQSTSVDVKQDYDYIPEEPSASPASAPHEQYQAEVNVSQHTAPSSQPPSAQQYEEPPSFDETSNPSVAQPNASTGLSAVALFEYERQDDDEIGFEVNDVITDIEQIDVGWWRGTCNGRYGLFPANYVQLRQ